ncbi:LysR family transcriptional regulator [Roseomonas sp. CCTCC AB2023176]|uniref:LysR family transcriptional regulator n=1 Tax=Roseomonas sp. CCTCC AB2023176 TaxID=3342640 RepID=UPI0035D82451
MDLTQIRYFLALSRTLNFTRAAEACNVTQPAFTRAIQRLEGELGGPLILRERSLTQLSELGRSMLPLLQSTHDAAEAALSRAAEHRRGADDAPLRLGLAPGLDGIALTSVLREVASRVQGLDVRLRRDAGPALVEALLAGDLDVALLPETGALPDRLNRWPLWSERIAVLLREDHPLAAAPAVPAAALDGASLVAPGMPGEAGPDWTPAAVAFARLQEEHGIRAVGRHAASCHPEAALLVAAGLGVGLAPEGAVLPPGIVARPLAAPEIAYPVILSAAAGRPMNRAVSAFVKLVRAARWNAGRMMGVA